MSWGKKITVLYLAFVALIVTLVVLCFGQKVELETKDYYAQEIKFQDKIDAISNEKNLATTITHQLQGTQIILNADSSLLSKGLEGTINFYRPSDSSKDMNLKMIFTNNQQIINTSTLIHGVYKMQLSWLSNGTKYFKENVIFIK
ncbi:MAG: FixH family protein [Burkholderiales bacterium]|nr:FixH family protein [Bacteroidia bacterium]